MTDPRSLLGEKTCPHPKWPFSLAAWPASRPTAALPTRWHAWQRCPGALAGFGANHHLRQSLVVLDRPTLQQPEAYIGGAAQLFASDGNIANESTQRFLAQYVAAFGAWVSRFVPA